MTTLVASAPAVTSAPSVKAAKLVFELSPSGNYFVIHGDSYAIRCCLAQCGYAWDAEKKLWKRLRSRVDCVCVECQAELCWLEKQLAGHAMLCVALPTDQLVLPAPPPAPVAKPAKQAIHPSYREASLSTLAEFNGKATATQKRIAEKLIHRGWYLCHDFSRRHLHLERAGAPPLSRLCPIVVSARGVIRRG